MDCVRTAKAPNMSFTSACSSDRETLLFAEAGLCPGSFGTEFEVVVCLFFFLLLLYCWEGLVGFFGGDGFFCGLVGFFLGGGGLAYSISVI